MLAGRIRPATESLVPPYPVLARRKQPAAGDPAEFPGSRPLKLAMPSGRGGREATGLAAPANPPTPPGQPTTLHPLDQAACLQVGDEQQFRDFSPGVDQTVPVEEIHRAGEAEDTLVKIRPERMGDVGQNQAHPLQVGLSIAVGSTPASAYLQTPKGGSQRMRDTSRVRLTLVSSHWPSGDLNLGL